ncbi:MAG TPA: hypothetical protein VFE31_07420 [Opitutaceae bacterium]|jgi:hypothetical protein|nr:hypothetical protein [Opitutaceae bacterium]
MKMHLAPVLVLLAPVPVFAAPDALPDVNVVVDVTAAGRKVRPPTPGHPVFYLPKMAPYTDEGAVLANDQPPPPPNVIAHQLAVALARQGYLYAGPRRRPDVVLAILYGSINPEYVSMPATSGARKSTSGGGSKHSKKGGSSLGSGKLKSIQVMLNQNDMVAMIQGDDVSGMDSTWISKPILDQLHYNRYFLMVAALDFTSFVPGKRPVTLWRERISIPAIHEYFGDAVGALIEKGAPFFGRDTRPRQFEIPSVPEGRVEVGTPTLKSPQP